MHLVDEPSTTSLERLKTEGKFLHRIYQAELARDPKSYANGSSRSNLMALLHTVKQVYGQAVALHIDAALDHPQKA